MFDGNWRKGVDQVVRPIGRNLYRAGVRPDHLTVIGLIMSMGAAVAIALGSLRLGLLLFILAGIPDLLDGQVAKAGGVASKRGAFFDSTADRVTDAFLLGGIAVYVAREHGAAWVALPYAVFAAGSVISYMRAKAESLGYDAKGGLMERAERLVVLGAALFFDSVMIPILVVMLALTLVTVAQRFAKVWQQASADRPAAPPSTWRRRRARAEQGMRRRERLEARLAARRTRRDAWRAGPRHD
jgi:CDP-diacylglycerol--glycerol-3-phosphate 3-phosphatidyltransferase